MTSGKHRPGTHAETLDDTFGRKVIGDDAILITILRNPADLFESLYHYYHLNRIWNENPFKEFVYR